jgi:hypothetical protein
VDKDPGSLLLFLRKRDDKIDAWLQDSDLCKEISSSEAG